MAIEKIKILGAVLELPGNVHKGRPTILGHFGHTYLPMSDVFYTMPITSDESEPSWLEP